MAAESSPVCARCKADSSLMWQRDSEGAVVCLDCHTAEKAAKSLRSSPSTDSLSSQNGRQSKTSSKVSQRSTPSPLTVPVQSGVTTRRTTRSHERAKARQQQQQQQQQPPAIQPAPAITTSSVPSPATVVVSTAIQPSTLKPDSTTTTIATTAITTPTTTAPTTAVPVRDKPDTPPPVASGSSSSTVIFAERGRRSLRQGPSVRAAEQQPFVISSTSVQHQGVVYEVGDVVSVLDRDGGVFYALTRGFMVDQYATKYIMLTWLLPKTPNPTHFDPVNFILGPEDDVPRSMEHIDFVCHSPQSRHFQASYLHNIPNAELWLTSNQ